jgi:Tfp pilus assembly protein PilW
VAASDHGYQLMTASAAKGGFAACCVSPSTSSGVRSAAKTTPDQAWGDNSRRAKGPEDQNQESPGGFSVGFNGSGEGSGVPAGSPGTLEELSALAQAGPKLPEGWKMGKTNDGMDPLFINTGARHCLAKRVELYGRALFSGGVGQ